MIYIIFNNAEIVGYVNDECLAQLYVEQYIGTYYKKLSLITNDIHINMNEIFTKIKHDN